MRLVRQLLTESLLLSLAGCAAALLFADWVCRGLRSFHLNTAMPYTLDFRLDWRVFVFAFAIALLTGMAVGIFPALRASPANLSAALLESNRTFAGRSRARTLLALAQVGGALMLLIGAGLSLRSLENAQNTRLGFDPTHLLTLTLDPHETGYSDAQGAVFYRQLLERVRPMPGVRSAALSFSLPMGYYTASDTVRVPGYVPPAGQPTTPIIPDNFVSPGYFQTLGIPILDGRDFLPSDVPGAANVVIVNETMAHEFWPGGNPIGREITFADAPPRKAQVIGIAKNSRFAGITGPIGPLFYAPLAQVYLSMQTLQLRTAAAPDSMVRDIRAAIRSLSPDMAVFDVQDMTQALQSKDGLLVYEFGAVLASALGILGLVLAVIGVYGVISYSTSQREKEIGIRMAVGARPAQVLRLVLWEGAVIAAVGTSLGTLAMIWIARFLSGFLVDVSPRDPFTYAGAAAILSVMAALACYLPARRAARVDPTVALRHE